jgi:hypothetical protein
MLYTYEAGNAVMMRECSSEVFFKISLALAAEIKACKFLR